MVLYIVADNKSKGGKMNYPEKMLYCTVCDTYTKHALSSSGKEYVCGLCGNVVTVEERKPEDMWELEE